MVILSPHGFFGQSNVLGLPDTGGQVVYILDVSLDHAALHCQSTRPPAVSLACVHVPLCHPPLPRQTRARLLASPHASSKFAPWSER